MVMWPVPRCQTKWAQPISPPHKERASHRVTLCPKTVLFIYLKIWLLVLELVIISIESIEILQKPVILIIGQTRRSPRLSQEIKILQYSYNSASHSSQVTSLYRGSTSCYKWMFLSHHSWWDPPHPYFNLKFYFSQKKEKKKKKGRARSIHMLKDSFIFFCKSK